MYVYIGRAGPNPLYMGDTSRLLRLRLESSDAILSREILEFGDIQANRAVGHPADCGLEGDATVRTDAAAVYHAIAGNGTRWYQRSDRLCVLRNVRPIQCRPNIRTYRIVSKVNNMTLSLARRYNEIKQLSSNPINKLWLRSLTRTYQNILNGYKGTNAGRRKRVLTDAPQHKERIMMVDDLRLACTADAQVVSVPYATEPNPPSLSLCLLMLPFCHSTEVRKKWGFRS
jgi:hypothetical protein